MSRGGYRKISCFAVIIIIISGELNSRRAMSLWKIAEFRLELFRSVRFLPLFPFFPPTVSARTTEEEEEEKEGGEEKGEASESRNIRRKICSTK